MAEITAKEIENEDFVQHAEVRIPIENAEEVRKAFETIAALRKRALDHLEVKDNPDDGAVDDYVSVDFKKVEGGGAQAVAILEVMMVSL